MRYYNLTEVHKRTKIPLRHLYELKRREAILGGSLAPFAIGEGRDTVFREDSIPVFIELEKRRYGK